FFSISRRHTSFSRDWSSDVCSSDLIAIAGFTPVPYKVFAIASGVFRISLPRFLVVSLLSRGARFFLEALLIQWYGEAMVAFITQIGRASCRERGQAQRADVASQWKH